MPKVQQHVVRYTTPRVVDIDEFLDVDARKLRLWTAVGVTARARRGVPHGRVARMRDVAENKAALYRPAPDRRLNSDSGNHDARPQPMGGLVWAILDMYHYTFRALPAGRLLDDSVARQTTEVKAKLKRAGQTLAAPRPQLVGARPRPGRWTSSARRSRRGASSRSRHTRTAASTCARHSPTRTPPASLTPAASMGETVYGVRRRPGLV